MKPFRNLRAIAPAAALMLALAASDPAAAFTADGALARGDARLESGEWVDDFEIEGRPGQTLVVNLWSAAFDPYLILAAPSGAQVANDDWSGNSSHSRIEFTFQEAGRHRIRVTSFEPGESGAYRLEALRDGDGGRIVRGRLENGDERLAQGEWVDSYEFEGLAGQRVVIDLASEAFDSYVMLRGPGGLSEDNDDWLESTGQSRIEATLLESGRHQVRVTSFAAGQGGAYTLWLPAAPAARAAAAGQAADPDRISGRLQRGDETLSDGEFFDRHTFRGQAGERVTIDLRSTDFDPYLMLRGPGDCSHDNDDHEGDPTWSRITATLPETGEYRILATSYLAGATGDYQLVISRQAPGDARFAGLDLRDSLASHSPRLDSGEHFSRHSLQAAPGTRLVVDLRSDDFDTFLGLTLPSGRTIWNDDHEGSTSHSRIEHLVEEAGEHVLLVTSYAAGETGRYHLSATGAATADEAPAHDLARLADGQRANGTLADGDMVLEAGEFADVYVFDGVAGRSLRVEMESSDVDTYLVVVMPDGRQVENDDFEGDLNRSRIDLPMQESGRYRIYATSYSAGERGSYTLLATSSATAPGPAIADSTGGRLFALSIGVADYGGNASDLSFTDQDARQVIDALRAEALLRPEHGILLTNREATVANVEAAFGRIAASARPEDRFVLFFSGHGSRHPRPGGPDRADPDGLDESIVCFDGPILDDRLAELLDEIRAECQIIIVDACFSGGLAKDLISAPGRMGLFSSEEDVVSSVAAKFRAGGYLSLFFADAVRGRHADADGDGAISALELCHYISERYRDQVKSDGEHEFVGGRDLSYQKLVADRGGIPPFQIILPLR